MKEISKRHDWPFKESLKLNKLNKFAFKKLHDLELKKGETSGQT